MYHKISNYVKKTHIKKKLSITEDRREILKVTEIFYTSLYESKIDNEDARRANNDQNKRICNVSSEDLPDIEEEEIRKALNQLKNGTIASYRKC